MGPRALTALAVLAWGPGLLGAGDIHAAIRAGDLGAVRQILAERPAAAAVADEHGNTPLHCAVLGGDLALVTLILDSPVAVNATNQAGDTALHLAVLQGSVPSATALLDRGADVNAVGLLGRTPLGGAVSDALCSALPGGGAATVVPAPTQGPGANPPRALREAMTLTREQTELVLLLLRRGANPDMPSCGGLPPLHVVAMCNAADLAALLIDHGAKVTAVTEVGWTALHWAVLSGGGQTAQVLLDRGAAVDAAIPNVGTALHLAAMSGQPAAAELLISRGAHVNRPNRSGDAPLHTAVSMNWRQSALRQALTADLTRAVDSLPADLDGDGKADRALRSEARTAVQLILHGVFPALPPNYEGAAKTLLDHNADLEARNGKGLTPLLVAACGPGGNAAAVRFLLERGADVRARDREGHSALHCAVSGARLQRDRARRGLPAGAAGDHGPPLLGSPAEFQEVVEQLVAAGVDVQARDRSGKTALSTATAGGLTDIAAGLRAAGARDETEGQPAPGVLLGDLTRRAEQGSGEAQYDLAETYRLGRGIARDFELALRWYREAARNGSLNALYQLGIMTYKGEGVEADCSTAYAYLQVAREELARAGTPFDGDQETAFRCVKEKTDSGDRRRARRTAEQIRQGLGHVTPP